MKKPVFAALAWMLCVQGALAEEAPPGPGAPVASESASDPASEVDSAPEDAEAASPPTPDLMNFCFFAGLPPDGAKYRIVKKLKRGKGTYGSVRDVLPQFARNAKAAGGDAVMNYSGSQRFGFFPWRLVRPVVHGTAIKWTDPKDKDCAALGGSTLQTILLTDEAPSRQSVPGDPG